ncbi:MAG: M15 family metallopeptidase [bacterium]
MRLACLIALAFVACDDGAPVEVAGHDTDLPPDVLTAVLDKADQVDCRQYDDGQVDGAPLLALVNKSQALRGAFVPPDLLPLGPEAVLPDRPALLLRASARAALDELASAGLVEAGVDLRARSAFRSFREQCLTFDYKVREHGLAHAEQYSARPGRSQHQLGTTVDLTAEIWDWELEPEMAETPEAAWLASNAGRFGFALSYPAGAEAVTGYAFEPWHFRYIGRDAAAELEASGLILETYLAACAAGDETLACPEEPQPEVAINQEFIGGACETDADCASLGPTALCLVEDHPGGYCTVPCTRGCPDRPGNNQLTFCHAEAPGEAWCRSQCDFDRFPDTGCRSAYPAWTGSGRTGAAAPTSAGPRRAARRHHRG